MKTNWSGERLETEVINFTTIEHLHRYAIAYNLCKGKIVLDIACGEGYGSNILSGTAERVIGVDISGEVIEKAKNKYRTPNLEFLTGSASAIPLPDQSVDLVVSFETIEHHDKHIEMMQEIKRVLRPGGLIILSSPDKKYYSDLRKYNNPFHIKELYFDEFKRLLKNYFTNCEFYLQKIVTGSLIVNENQSGKLTEYTGSYEKIERVNGFAGMYNICVASDEPLPIIELSIFDGTEISHYYYENTLNQLKNSRRYKLGNALMRPYDWIRCKLK